MTALLHRLLADRPPHRRILVPPPRAARSAVNYRQSPLAATAERLATTRELDNLRSTHPRRINTGQ